MVVFVKKIGNFQFYAYLNNMNENGRKTEFHYCRSNKIMQIIIELISYENM